MRIMHSCLQIHDVNDFQENYADDEILSSVHDAFLLHYKHGHDEQI